MTYDSPAIPPGRVFVTDEHRTAAAAIVATVNLGHDHPDLLSAANDARGIAQLAQMYGDLEEISPLDVVVAASVIVTKLMADEHVVWRVNARRTIARLGAWVAGDELARGV